MRLWLIVLGSLVPLIQTQFTCPGQCQCYPDPIEKNRIMHLTCKWTQINSTNLESIRHFDAVRTLTIKCSQKFGQLADPSPGLFSRLRYLDRLEIDRCRIDKLPPDLFYGMNYLYSLIVKNADLAEIPANAFQHLTNLMSLDLSGNKLRIEPQALFSLNNLLQLDLSNNSISYLSNVLMNLGKLKVISFSNNLIENVDFRRLPQNLTDLTLRNNKVKTLHSFSESAMNLKRLDLSMNELDYIAASGSVNQLPAYLSVLDLSDNKISRIQEGAFKHMASLSLLDLRNNSLTEISEESLEINRTKFRVQLYLSGNPLTCICENYWILHPKSKSSPIIADMANVTCDHVLDESRKLSLLDADLMSGFLCRYDSNCLEGCDCCSQKPEGKCNCYRVCPAGCRCWGSAGAHAQKLGQNVVSCHNVRMDRMRYVPDGVTELHLVGSMWRDKGLAKLGDKPYLTLLNLSDSSITYLNRTLLDQFPKLTMLDLSSNRLKTIYKSDVKGLKNLRVLYLKNNELEEFADNTLELFDELQKITLGGNRTSFLCHCNDNQTVFQRWLFKDDNKQKIPDLNLVMCTNPIHGLISIDRTDPSHPKTICPGEEAITEEPTTSEKKNIKDDDDDYFEEDAKLTEMDKDEQELEETKGKKGKSTAATSTSTTTDFSPYDIPTKPAKSNYPLTKVSMTLKPVESPATTTEPDEEKLSDEDFFMNLAPNSKAIRTISKEHTTPAPRKDFDSHILFSVLIVFLLFVVVALICAIASTVYYRLIRPGRYNSQKVRARSQDEEIPLNNRQ
ncbi:hypothetical protein FO519_003291 [Halicephalobus sp. NKZ332]|nr:hypothetical protein FO519_003291 [Halicephalobus sp. NKZ332]